jgi:predicted porin
MKKILFTFAAITAATCTFAQEGARTGSSLTIFGIADAALSYGRANAGTKWQVTNSGNTGSRLGFRGSEDMGGGMRAHFWLEAGVASDTGTGVATNTNNQTSGAGPALAGGLGLIFNRAAYVGLAGPWGDVRLGRETLPHFRIIAAYDPYAAVGVGANLQFTSIITGPTAARASNSINYYLPPIFGGWSGWAGYWLGENASNAAPSTGSGGGFSFGYSSSEIDVVMGHDRTHYGPSPFASGGATGTAGRVRHTNITARWTVGGSRVLGSVERDAIGDVGGKSWMVGAIVPFGPHDIKVTYSRYTIDGPVGTDPQTSKLALGYVYNLSKRTRVYATGAWARNSAGARAVLNGGVASLDNKSASGFDFGINHSF